MLSVRETPFPFSSPLHSTGDASPRYGIFPLPRQPRGSMEYMMCQCMVSGRTATRSSTARINTAYTQTQQCTGFPIFAFLAH